MNFQTMSKQRKFVLISAVVGFISMFLPWVSISEYGYSQSVNGIMRDKGIIVFLCFVASGVVAYLGDQTKNLGKNMWAITLAVGALALLIIIWFYFQAKKDNFTGSSLVGFGLYIGAIAAIGILASAYIFRSPTDNIKDSFNSIKKDIGSRMSSTGSAASSTPPTSTTTTDQINSSVGDSDKKPESTDPPL